MVITRKMADKVVDSLRSQRKMAADSLSKYNDLLNEAFENNDLGELKFIQEIASKRKAVIDDYNKQIAELVKDETKQLNELEVMENGGNCHESSNQSDTVYITGRNTPKE